MYSQFFQYYPQMLLVFLNTLGVNKYVVDKDFVHEIYEICRCIGESKRHYGKLKLSVSGDKGCLWDVAFSYLELEIS